MQLGQLYAISHGLESYMPSAAAGDFAKSAQTFAAEISSCGIIRASP